MKKVAIFGGSFNPPGIHHLHIANLLAKHFDHVVIVPCGPRPDKLSVNDTEPIHRAALTAMAFGELHNVSIDNFDLEQNVFTRTHDLEQRYQKKFGPSAQIWHVVGTDLIIDGHKGESLIQKEWMWGKKIWQELNYCIIARQGYPLDHRDLPPKSMILEGSSSGSSSTIRDYIFRHQQFEHLVLPNIATYIHRYGLYRGLPPKRFSGLETKNPKIRVIYDKYNPKAVALAQKIAKNSKNPDLLVVIGGDGTMLRAIRDYWHLRIPFFGINTGHLGFLLNEVNDSNPLHIIQNQSITLWHLPLLYSEITLTNGKTISGFAFNDARVERASGQTGWFSLAINDQVQIAKITGDILLVATAAGSTAYARSMGASPIPVGTPGLLLVGSNIVIPQNWQKVINLSEDCRITIAALDSKKRPLRAFIDNEELGPVEKMTIRLSRVAAVELGFFAGRDMMEKLLKVQFPANELASDTHQEILPLSNIQTVEVV